MQALHETAEHGAGPGRDDGAERDTPGGNGSCPPGAGVVVDEVGVNGC